MKFTRRDFVKLSGFAAVASIGFSGSAFGKTTNDVLSIQTAENFRRLIGTEFYIWRDDFTASATLTKVEDFPKPVRGGECFSMSFETRLKNAEQGTYNIFHPTLGNFELFLTEGRNGKRCVFLATVNRL